MFNGTPPSPAVLALISPAASHPPVHSPHPLHPLGPLLVGPTELVLLCVGGGGLIPCNTPGSAGSPAPGGDPVSGIGRVGSALQSAARERPASPQTLPPPFSSGGLTPFEVLGPFSSGAFPPVPAVPFLVPFPIGLDLWEGGLQGQGKRGRAWDLGSCVSDTAPGVSASL